MLLENLFFSTYYYFFSSSSILACLLLSDSSNILCFSLMKESLRIFVSSITTFILESYRLREPFYSIIYAIYTLIDANVLQDSCSFYFKCLISKLLVTNWSWISQLASRSSARSWSLESSLLFRVYTASSRRAISSLSSLLRYSREQSTLSFWWMVIMVSSWNLELRSVLWALDLSLKLSLMSFNFVIYCQNCTSFCYSSYFFLLVSTSFSNKSAYFFLLSATLFLSSLFFPSRASKISVIFSKNYFNSVESPHPRVIADSFKNWFNSSIDILTFYQRAERLLKLFTSSYKALILDIELLLSWKALSACSMFAKL